MSFQFARWKTGAEGGVARMTLSGSLMSRSMTSWSLMPGTVSGKGKVFRLGIAVRLLLIRT